ncbi:MAG: hypothetical protein B6U68_03745 [Candidatus Aenigmarchaeota archaeon ex4484_14]|nr:MAG: hypothetical protein B6U68_03745 [Candidatus Aenigmarchaeota archaeon ex4484_14]
MLDLLGLEKGKKYFMYEEGTAGRIKVTCLAITGGHGVKNVYLRPEYEGRFKGDLKIPISETGYSFSPIES